MNQIDIRILNPESIIESEKMMVCAARLTQRGHNIKNIDDFVNLYNQGYKPETAIAMTKLPHPTIQKFGVINIVIVGASRRFLAQITRHQNEVKFMSASLQYSDYSGQADFVVPYAILERGEDSIKEYLKTQQQAMNTYKEVIDSGIDNDSAGYLAPQGLRNILIISATPYQWKHMIGQRVCKRNTTETRYVMLKIWEALNEISPLLFSNDTTGPFCMKGPCLEGKMACGKPFSSNTTPSDILKTDFPLLIEN